MIYASQDDIKIAGKPRELLAEIAKVIGVISYEMSGELNITHSQGAETFVEEILKEILKQTAKGYKWKQ